VALLPLSTRGDELVDRRLDEAGGKGLFVKELEQAILERRADLAVHSMKDVPAELPAGFVLGAVLAREDARDAFVSNRYRALDEMKPGEIVGTSSLRRAAQIGARHPALEVRLLRGNVDTRIAKLDRGEYDAIVLAVAGLVRLNLENRIRSRLSIEESLPAPGQGALGIEFLADRADVAEVVKDLNDPPTELCVAAERAVSRALGGSCALPLGAFAEPCDEGLRLRSLVASRDGRRIVRAECRGAEPAALAAQAVADLRSQGAEEVLSALGS
jgi:hydroxymethylbilane synthase